MFPHVLGFNEKIGIRNRVIRSHARTSERHRWMFTGQVTVGADQRGQLAIQVALVGRPLHPKEGAYCFVDDPYDRIRQPNRGRALMLAGRDKPKQTLRREIT